MCVNSNQHHYLPLSGFQIYFTIIAGHQGGNNIDGGGGADFVVVFVVSKLSSVFVFPVTNPEPLNLQKTESINGIKRVEWIELNWIELNRIELNRTELQLI